LETLGFQDYKKLFLISPCGLCRRGINKVFYHTGSYRLQGGNLQAKWYHLSKKGWMFPPFFYLIFRALIINPLHPQNFSEVVFIRPKIIFRIITRRIFPVFPRAPERHYM
jgi:hypothetical protein